MLVVKRSARDRIRREGGILQTLDVVVAVEVISPGSRRTDTVVKRAEYADAGIPHYWILDLAEPVSLLALHLAGELGYAYYSHAINAGVFADLGGAPLAFVT